MGGTYNEPNTNLTSPETTIRNLVHGIGFQRDVLGAEPATAWQLDVFGHDPQFPGLAADAGLTSSSWARGPHHQWGPAQGGVDRMQFCSEFEWIAPSGRGLLTHYMPAHYSAGWSMDSSTSLADAEPPPTRCSTAQKGRADPERAHPGPAPAASSGSPPSPRLGCALHLAALRVRAAQGVLRRGARRTGQAWLGAVARRPAT
ncbi:Alpha-mannosidase [Mycobacterium tuberculosis CAS/NITR204]|uniref:Alpha-mannosidase n=1 Tax=Mycobacterium tuberculosis CAS/NITR204 TaxID=1310114 RepID=R4MF79_MYCTX|nr:Alpha-mannosidase [Mycobacterium tuberculosis CAS/NITR204]